MYKLIIKIIVLTFVFMQNATARPVPGCGDLTNGYGPYDYTNPMHFEEKLPIVERHHFTYNVESLKRGETGEDPAGDLDYTLRAFPNHHRALYSVINYDLINGSFSAKYYSAECYFRRALAFKPDDGVAWMLYGIYQHKKMQYQKALKSYKQANSYIPDSADLHYNMGLLFFDMKQYDKSLEHAKKAYSLGHPLSGLRLKLQQQGVWD